jgi:SRSO17 transposase
MSYTLNADGEQRLEGYFDRMGRVLGRKDRREAFAIYATGLLGDGERKSVEPIAAAACGDPERCRAFTERLLHFVGESDWDDRGVRLSASRYAIAEMVKREPVQAWIFDDTGFIKQGDRSPGVQRQYTGSAGKTTNCQIGVSLTVATRTVELPVDMDLYLPESWAADRRRCRAAHIPDEVDYRAKCASPSTSPSEPLRRATLSGLRSATAPSEMSGTFVTASRRWGSTTRWT